MSAWFKCDRCGSMVEMRGGKNEPPEHWATIQLLCYRNGSQCAFGHADHLCSQCLREFADVIGRWKGEFTEFMDEPRKLRGVTRNA